MRERLFVDRRQAGWTRLEALLERTDRAGLRGFERAELRELALLYRAATSDLAAARSRRYGSELSAYLNRLTARAYVVVYAGAARGGWSRIGRFFGATFPREIRRAGKIIAATSTLFVLAWIVSYWLVASRPANAYALVPAEAVPAIVKSLHDSNFGFDRSFAPAMSSMIITNNIKVAMLAFAGGMTLGILTIWEILNNGLMVGSLGALFAARGFGTDFWATIAPHGVIELTAIQIAGAAGLLLAQAIVAPGRLRRSDALKANARRAGVLMIGVAGLLVVAGLIEGFVTPQRTTELVRFGVGALTAVALLAYIALAGRGRAGDDGSQNVTHTPS
ncbi:MAG: stage II sporulation protein M [Vulcanimicrobiaceae bacterium]